MNVVSLSEEECRTIIDKLNTLTAAVQLAIVVLDDPWLNHKHQTARDLRELLDRQSSGNPGQLSDRVTESHDVDWGACPKCGCCTELAFRGWPHGSLQDVVCGKCDWSGALAKLEAPQESG